MNTTTTREFNHDKKCIVCQSFLTGRQKQYCSRKCHNHSGNKRHQNYVLQQNRGLTRRIELLKFIGGQCEVCGYNKNIAALAFHHKDPANKTSELTIRECSNNAFETLKLEACKCRLLCHNCHMEHHHPHYNNLL